METELTVEILGGTSALPPFSARGCVQTLELLPQGELHRTVNGDLVLVGDTSHAKYRSRITCQDKSAVALSGAGVGNHVRVGCIQRLVESVSAKDKTYQLKTLAVPGSVVFISEDGQKLKIPHHEGRQVKFPKAHGPGYLSYRPLLDMRIVAYILKTDEWGMTVGWTLDLDEI